MAVKLAFIAIRGKDGILKPLSKKEVRILQEAPGVEFRYLPELKDFFYNFCNEKFDVFERQVKNLIAIPIKFFNPSLNSEFLHENGFKIKLFLQIFEEGNDRLLERITSRADILLS